MTKIFGLARKNGKRPLKFAKRRSSQNLKIEKKEKTIKKVN